MSKEEEGDVSERGITEEDGCWVKNKTVSVCAFVCVYVCLLIIKVNSQKTLLKQLDH